MKQEYLVSVVIVAAIIGGLYLARPIISVQPSEVVVQGEGQNFGAVPGSAIQGEEFTVNGVTEYRYFCSFANTSTSTPCSIALPSASTTPVYVAMKLTGNTSVKGIYVAVAADRWASTTGLIAWTGTAGKLFAGSASTTLINSTIVNNVLIGGGPHKYMNLQLDGTPHTATGTMEVILRAI